MLFEGAWAFVLVVPPSLALTPWFKHVENDAASLEAVRSYAEDLSYEMRKLTIRLQSKQYRLRVVR